MHRYPLHKWSSFDLATAKQLQKTISLLVLLESGQRWVACLLGKKMQLRKELNQRHTHTQVLLRE